MELPFSHERFAACAEEVAKAGRGYAERGWTPATSSNFSMRIDANFVAVTVSGRDKALLTASDVMVVDLAGNAVATVLRPSAETLLHTQLYRRFPYVGAVLHTHSMAQTLASKLWATSGHIVLADYELLKAFPGVRTHESALCLPVFANSQDMPALVSEIDRYMDANPQTFGYLIEGHGIYTWGETMADARRHLDAFEFVLACELELRKLKS